MYLRDSALCSSIQLQPRTPHDDADLREDHHWGDPHGRGRGQRHGRHRQGQDPGQARNHHPLLRRRRPGRPAPAAVSRVRREAARGGGRPDAGRLRRRQGVDAAPRARPPRRLRHLVPPHRPRPPRPCARLHREQTHLPKVLRTPSSEIYQLPQEEVRPQQPPKEEEDVQYACGGALMVQDCKMMFACCSSDKRTVLFCP